MMTNAWKLGERPKYEGQKAWGTGKVDVGQKQGNRRGGPVSKTTPWGVSEDKTDYTTSSNPKQ